ncbi:hypothetical protein SFBSU_006G433 [Candidatus Arthromitus sp. SFB-mouse-SU]|uniref:heparan-alpha-glucosaminide N-acetyltransferase domain-containing protein n=1 Tax=Candidatus Arthromitus sp. SFB-mouse TaxID=49118 RepID=UPI0002296960|nr:heparan-alpha-glucosaminide N-acetyltransferase domain-containing protein [Candidatus Arthromitus sp. SFB-mouse]EIA23857.1 hypothetical protein SFB1_106G4 [Candidatus Arthromitus sp. SFB-1]EIA25238.1 hypothetical protein SFB3_135G6 [Candidatus Arthromitus sp. SFB-3]EIA26830.1 hypothetical protein SFB5_246G8 [Candidatus Arthromitus sp. SFB-5]EIA28580.1 hypothetical protein SFB6_039G8 [Candidatus Arthromitus sp. SFB-co]EIA30752.1 hypothetical protein SFBSU_006G433 [Candidatus Arthromitus sp. 
MNEKRYFILDGIRGFAVINMIIYHFIWDLVYIFRFDIPWFESEISYIWQQFICCTFIFISGFCEPLGTRKLKRGIIILGLGILIEIVTMIATPENRVRFGILTLLGSCAILIIPAKKFLEKFPSIFGLILSIALFLLTKNINDGYLGFNNLNLIKLPSNLYKNSITTYLGFPMPNFYSTDYFSLMPWIFLYISGYFSYQIFKRQGFLKYLKISKIKSLEWIGRNSLALYVIHQPLIYFLIILFL